MVMKYIQLILNLIELAGLIYIYFAVRRLRKEKETYIQKWRESEDENALLKTRMKSLEDTIEQLAVKEVDYSDFDESK